VARTGTRATTTLPTTCTGTTRPTRASLCDTRVFNDGVGVIGAIGMWGTVIDTTRALGRSSRTRRACGLCGPASRQGRVRPGDRGGAERRRVVAACASTRGHTKGVPARRSSGSYPQHVRRRVASGPSIPATSDGDHGSAGSEPAQVGSWGHRDLGDQILVIGLVFTLWLLGLALVVVGAVLGAVGRAVGIVDPAPTPTTAVLSQSEDDPAPGAYSTVRNASGSRVDLTEERTASARIPTSLTCGVPGRPRRVRALLIPTYLLGFAEQTDGWVDEDAYRRRMPTERTALVRVLVRAERVVSPRATSSARSSTVWRCRWRSVSPSADDRSGRGAGAVPGGLRSGERLSAGNHVCHTPV
jgi:hypothetical protein